MSDLIERQAAIDGLEKYHEGADLHIDGLTYAYDLICKLPSVSYSEKPNRSGEWIPNPPYMAKCSLCGYIQSTNGADLTGKALVHKAIYKYCPNCGAKMGVEE